MLDRYSGKLLHIDFGDCFEASMHREKFPERVPFRLTRMMVKAMEAAGIEGNFRFACEATARVLRANKDSVLAMLEAFVHDPLINWRLLNTADAGGGGGGGADDAGAATAPAADGGATVSVPVTPRALSPRLPSAGGSPSDPIPRAPSRLSEPPGDANEALNERAVAVMKRTSDKLTGRDWVADGGPGGADADSIPAQVERLIQQATSHENLCQSYIGWCPFW